VRIGAAANPQKLETSRDQDIDQARSLMVRLRDPSIAFSEESDDIWIVQTFRRICSVTITPNQHDYGAAAYVELDFSAFFVENPSLMSKTEFTRRFVVRMPPAQDRPRRLSVTSINLKMLHEPEKYRLSDEEWAAIEALLQPAWQGTSGKNLSRTRKYYEALILNMRAGGHPNTMHGLQSGKVMSLICSFLRKRRLWAPLLAELRKFGNEWIFDLNPSLVNYLNGEGGNKDTPWVVEDMNG
jgi:hypothetical protein